MDEDKSRALKELRTRTLDLLQARHDDKFLMRWLIARDFNVDAAEKMLREDFKFRKKFGSDTVLEDFVMNPELQKFRCDKVTGFDKDGNVVKVTNVGTCDLKGFTRSMTYMEIEKYFIQGTEFDLKVMEENNLKTGKHGERFVIINDLTGYRASSWCDREVWRFCTELMKLYQDHYPERLKLAYILNAPSLFCYLFGLLKPLFNEVVWNKIRLHSVGDDSWKKELFSSVPKECIPAYLGGELYYPDAKCSGFICWDQKIPTSLYLKDKSTLKLTDPGVKEKVIQQRSVFEVQQYVEQVGSILSWAFETKDHSIRFGLFYQKGEPDDSQGSSGQTDREELMPIEVVECNEYVEAGEYTCTKPGTYILHFDNTHSWLRSKRLLFKTEVRPPEHPVSDI